jgi:DNA (cytosine-5)-methyltransferase 1
MTYLRLGSMCSGAGMLDLALAQVLDVEPVWHAENDPHASRVLAHHWPTVPNLGDITAVDWATVPPVDVVTAGFPCQPVSEAGRRAGVTDERWLFDVIADAVGRMVVRPRLLVFENVRGLLTANGGDAMGRVVHGLARLGYVGSWRTLRASDVGAPHRRERVFVVAADADGAVGGQAGNALGGDRRSAHVGGGAPQPGGRRGAPADSDGAGPQGPGSAEASGHAEPAGGGDGTAPHPDGQRFALWPELDSETLEREADHEPRGHDPHRLGDLAWGAYGPAIRRWERILNRTPPAPTDAAGRLNPPFVEWMLGLEPGWVTAVPGVPRTAQLAILGNGVVVAQGAAALADLLAHLSRSDAA